jgi:hypothetical protein
MSVCYTEISSTYEVSLVEAFVSCDHEPALFWPDHKITNDPVIVAMKSSQELLDLLPSTQCRFRL